MRLQHIAIITALGIGGSATPHSLNHHHVHKPVKRGAWPDNVVDVPVATVTSIIYWLDGHSIPEEEVRQGIANGTLVWGDDDILSTSTNGPVVLATPAPTPDEQSPVAHKSSQPHIVDDVPATLSSSPSPQAPPATHAKQSPPSSLPSTASSDSSPVQQLGDPSKSWADLVDKNGYCSSCDKEFPNNKIPCTEFPYGYGALPIPHEGLGGWSGIQDPRYNGGDGFDDIRTVVKGSCSDGSCCTAGSFCSYGCPNPYLKLSFPSKQGRTGQSVGGLYCNNNGYLEMADGSLGKTLCGQSSKSMTVKVQNNLSKSVSFCRTDYPGTESMTFPFTLGPGQSGFLASPDQGKYYIWKGLATSAQYYVNKQGIPEDEACTWGSPMRGKGNWSPTILGTSWDDLKAHEGFTSLFQNPESYNERLDYDITFTGDGVVSPCAYKKASGQYCQDGKCSGDIKVGCTAAIKPGSTLLITLSDG